MAQADESKENRSTEPETIDLNEIRKENLLRNLKKEVKQIMEEAVTRRFIHEESPCVTTLCAAVEACLAHGLKRRVLGLFGTTSTFALLHKISKLCPPAASVLRIVIQTQQKEIKERSSSTTGSFEKFKNSSFKNLPVSCKYLWIRVAIFEKLLPIIVDFIVKEAEKFYDREALMMDSVHSCMVASLLVGPCALEYTKMKTADHYWTDPPADELIQRHRLHSRKQFQPGSPSPKSPRPTLQVRRSGSVGPDEFSPKIPCCAGARDYVLSLHQNHKTTLLYGKNNVSVCPPDMKDPLKGYLSLHQNANSTLSIKWTPNELMHSDSEPKSTSTIPAYDKNVFWQYALNLNVDEIVYLHFHQQGDTGGSIVFVGADGVQHPPVHFPVGQHPLAFLSCLENGLLPWGQLDPPLWLQKGKGKVFPKLRRRSSSVVANGKVVSEIISPPSDPISSKEEEIRCVETPEDGADLEKPPNLSPVYSQDFVFRIVPMCRPGLIDDFASVRTQSNSSSSASSKLVALSSFSSRLKERFLSISSSPASSPPLTPKTTSSGDIEEEGECPNLPADHAPIEKRHSEPVMTTPSMSFGETKEDSADHSSPSRTCLKSACDSMRYQILSRAFYGWLAHCRHLQTIRTHLSCLVFPRSIQNENNTPNGVSVEDWKRLRENPSVAGEVEFYALVYYGGVSPELRRSVWPHLLGFVSWSESVDSKLESCRTSYETMMIEWMVVEAIVRQRDKEMFDAARESQEGCTVDTRNELWSGKNSSLSSEVFEYHDVDESRVSTSAEINKDEDDNDTPRPGGRSPELSKQCQLLQGPREDENIEEALKSVENSGRSTPEEGEGGIYSKELIDTFSLNLHRIEKDVHRCDRSYPYFTTENLEKLKNVMCTYVWEHLESGYVQGMCDLAAPLLVIFDDEILAYGCFSQLMERMGANFPHGGGMDMNLANMRSLIQVMDPELFELMHRNGDYTHFYFCYRWFLLDFKRELVYDDVFLVWEVIWAASKVSSAHFVLFLALGLLILYREIILDNNMDFTDIIKFFNEMAEKHDAVTALELARSQVKRLQLLIETNTK